MAAGTEIRNRTRRGDAVVGLALSALRVERQRSTGRSGVEESETPDVNRAYVLSSLKHPDEVETLRKVYGGHLVIVGVHADRHARVADLARQLSGGDGGRSEDHRVDAETLMRTDEGSDDGGWGQNTRDTFPLADYFITASGDVAEQVERLTWLVFGRPCVTPSLDEMGMLHATSGSWRSAALGRQVGAAVLDSMGDVLAIGMNEVPAPHGGHYWAGGKQDARDFRRGFDANDVQKKKLVTETIRLLQEAGWLSTERTAQRLEQLAADAYDGPLRRGGIRALTEFGRDVHAEMSAIVSAARRGVALRGAVLYCTTYPCHNCTKHIIAAGISEVVYIEPYPKSFATELHDDAIAQDSTEHALRVNFRSFSGAAPRNHGAWFAMGAKKRKSSNGKVIPWTEATADPRFPFNDAGYIARERELVVGTRRALLDAGLIEDVDAGPEEEEDGEREGKASVATAGGDGAGGTASASKSALASDDLS